MARISLWLAESLSWRAMILFWFSSEVLAMMVLPRLAVTRVVGVWRLCLAKIQSGDASLASPAVVCQ